ncbi:MAG: sulfatase [Kiritimatiellales bacterium]
MKQRIVIGASSLITVAAVAQTDRPNVIFFLVDDMGWMDSSLYGSKFYKTPAMERLAESSVRFINAYSASPLCSPSRASIISGQYPARHGITSAHGHQPHDPDLPLYQEPKPSNAVLLPNSKRSLDPAQYTLAEAFRDAGYRTGFVGKWHLGLEERFWPEQQGFEVTFHGAPDAGPKSYFSPYQFQAGTVTDGPDGEYLTDRATDEALAYIHNGDQRPFFLCLWHWAVHGPWAAKRELIQYYNRNPDPAGLQQSAVMAAMIQSMDESLGRLLDDLEKTGLDKNTIIIFTSDNGGVVKKGPNNVPATSNAPLRNGKASLFEGGTRVPALIRWPGVADVERLEQTVITGVDYYPTLLEMCGLSPNPEQILDGVSLVPLLKGQALNREAIFCYFPWAFGNWSPAGAWVRQGDWKLIDVFNPGASFPDAYELYNLKDDIGETRNLAEQLPERVVAMKALLQQHYETTGALPLLPNPGYLVAPPEPDTKTALSPAEAWIRSGPGASPVVRNGVLHVDSRGITTTYLPENLSGKMTLKVRVNVPRGAPNGAVFWKGLSQPVFDAQHRAGYRLEKPDRMDEIEVAFQADEAVTELRIDFGDKEKRKGPARVEWIKLYRSDGSLAAEWSF